MVPTPLRETPFPFGARIVAPEWWRLGEPPVGRPRRELYPTSSGRCLRPDCVLQCRIARHARRSLCSPGTGSWLQATRAAVFGGVVLARAGKPLPCGPQPPRKSRASPANCCDRKVGVRCCRWPAAGRVPGRDGEVRVRGPLRESSSLRIGLMWGAPANRTETNDRWQDGAGGVPELASGGDKGHGMIGYVPCRLVRIDLAGQLVGGGTVQVASAGSIGATFSGAGLTRAQ